MKTITIDLKLLLEYLEGNLSKEEKTTTDFLLLSDEKNYWEFVGLRALKEANLLEEYLKIDLSENIEETQITQRELSDYIKNKLSLEEHQKIKKILLEDKKTNFEYIKLNALFQEEELDNYLESESFLINSILEKVENQTNEYTKNQEKKTENIKPIKDISLKTYVSFAASFLFLILFSFLMYGFFKEKKEIKLALENKQNEYQTLGTHQDKNKLEDRLILYTEDALDIFIANLSIMAKMTKEQKEESSKLHVDMMKEYLGLTTKITIAFVNDLDKKSKFSDFEMFLDWFLVQEKVKMISLKNYTVIIKEEKSEGKEVIIKNGKIENSVPSNFSKEDNLKIEFTNLIFEIE